MSLQRSTTSFGRSRASLALFLLLATGCAVNPVTGDREFVLISEAQEIQMGRDSDPSVVASLGLVEDAALQSYVSELGTRMARASERPNLPWTFRVLDDPTVNAFALPGGFIYVTRGILTHFSSEAELAGVLGHEIGHVTARHGVSQMSRSQLAQVGLGVGSILAPDLAPYAELAGAGLGLLLLSYGRDAERQADGLGLRYMTREGYDPAQMAVTFGTLAAASGAEDGERIPGFLSTHPDPLARRQEVLQRVASGEFSGERIERERYLQRLEGMVFGPNPRDGYFDGPAFFHPDLAFRFDFPQGWQTVNQRQAVQGVSAEGDAALILSVAEGNSARAARDAFIAAQGITGTDARNETRNGLPAARAEFSANTQQGIVRGAILFVEHRGLVFQLLGYAPDARWSARSGAIGSALNSFRPVSDPGVLNRQPARVRLVRTDRAMTLQEFHQRFPSEVPIATIGLLNQLSAGSVIPAGTLLKRVVTAAP